MTDYVETILPSGRAVRLRPLETAERLAIERRVTTAQGDEISKTIEILCTALVAYTPSHIATLYKPEKGPKGENVPDPDATFASIKDWQPVTYDLLKEEGGKHSLLSVVLKDLRDWNRIQSTLDASYNVVAPPSVLSGKVRSRSVSS